MNRFKADIPFLILWIALILSAYVPLVYFAIELNVPSPWYVEVFVAINVATFALFGVDKLLAAAGTRRVPERTLHATAFLFGSPGALAAMQVFRHKTRKTSFQLVLALLVLAQVLLILGAVYYLEPNLQFPKSLNL